MSIILDAQQQQAVDACCDPIRRVVAITGEAGTGKTTIMRQVFARLSQLGETVALTAPTGKASRRITEVTGIHAVTMHKLLKYSRPEIDIETGEAKGATVPKYGKANRLPFRVVIADEYAMVNEELHRNLLDALADGARICVFGDISQLPPIEEYAINADSTPFERLLRLPGSVALEKVYRQTEESPILANAHRIRKGNMPARRPKFDIKMTHAHLDVLLRHVEESKAKGIDYRRIDNQIITPATKTWIGTKALNQALQAIHIDMEDPDVVALKLPRFKWDEKFTTFVHVGEKVICTENTYDLRDYRDRFTFIREDASTGLDSDFIEPPITASMLNGETGTVVALHDNGGLEIDFGDRCVLVPPYFMEVVRHDNIWVAIRIDPRKRLDLAYAITTHKAQGSEFENVTYIMGRSTWYNSNRNNFYTAVTRARDSFTLITDSDSLLDSLRMDAKAKSVFAEKYRKQNAALRVDNGKEDKGSGNKRASR